MSRSFTVNCPDVDSGQTLLVGLAAPGMASLTAVSHIVDSVESTEIGHISPAELPAITPFEDGIPRHHTRLYDLDNTDIVVLLSELFVPPFAARPFVEQVTEWAADADISDITMFHPVPYEHAPEDHQVFFVATESYREQRLNGDLQPMNGGMLDGVPGEFLSNSLTETAPPTGVYVTPAHPPGPDVDAALLFLDALESVYDFSVDQTSLENLSQEIKTHYETLGERMAELEAAEQSRDDREFYADRMYM